MRADMSKVIVERPRKKGRAWNRPKGALRRMRRYGEDGPPSREGIKVCWGDHTKWLNEHLGPLRRYLDKQVGRPWNKVFSEICEHIDRNSAVQDHVRDHISDYVTTNVIVIAGILCCGEGNWNYGRPLHELGYRPWYVCPRTGLLRRIKPASRKHQLRPKNPDLPKFVRVSETLQCRIINGAWHLVTLKPLRDPHHQRKCSTEVDVVLQRRVVELSPTEAKRHFGAEVYAVAVRRLALRELRNYPIPECWRELG
jgi:hypothetical protein